MKPSKWKSTSTTTSASKGLLDSEVDFPKGPEDTISALRWSPVADHLAAASWDGRVYIYDATNHTSTDSVKGVAAIAVGAPVLDCDFSKDGTLALGAGADKKIHIMDLASTTTTTLEAHEAPVRSARFVEIPSVNAPIVASGSWDKTVRYWDLRQRDPLGVLALPERVYAMDADAALLAVATADNRMQLVDLRANPLEIWRSLESPLKYQTTSASVAPGGTRWAIGGIDGRAAAQVSDEKDKSLDSLQFKCHRTPSTTKSNQTDVYPVNAVCFSPAHKDVLATAGGPVTAVAFSRDGMALAYAVGYDWAKGYMHNKEGGVRKIGVRYFAEGLK